MEENHVLFDGLSMVYALPQLCTIEKRIWSPNHILCLNNLFLGIVLWDKIRWIPDSILSLDLKRLLKDDAVMDLFNLLEDVPEEEFNPFVPDSNPKHLTKNNWRVNTTIMIKKFNRVSKELIYTYGWLQSTKLIIFRILSGQIICRQIVLYLSE